MPMIALTRLLLVVATSAPSVETRREGIELRQDHIQNPNEQESLFDPFGRQANRVAFCFLDFFHGEAKRFLTEGVGFCG